MKKIFINYADGFRFEKKQASAMRSFKKFNEFDEYILGNKSCIGYNFYQKIKTF